ncbi:MAG TPA: ABC transporter permease [Gemmatimonadaceae bacterium]|nr:ABC transporter permease [Gemmatimonadaceae bacterium]
MTWAELGDWEQAGTFERAAVFRTASINLVGDGEPERPVAALVTDGFLATLRVAPALGRQFRPEEFDPAAPAVAIISHGLWMRRYTGARDVLGRTIRISGTPTEIVGVLPRDMQYPEQVDVFLPLRLTPQIRENFARRDNYLFLGIARLAPGKSLEATRHELDALARRVEAEVPAAREGVTMIATPLTRSVVGATNERTLWILLGAVGCILLIACVNVANLLLSRAAVRRREFAVRAALGAARPRLVRQYLVESLLLGLGGGLVGVGIAFIGVRALVAAAPANTPRLENIAVNPTVLLAALVLSVCSAVLFGLVPALQSTAGKPLAALGDGGARTGGGIWSKRVRTGLVIGELSLSLVLLAGAGLLLRSFQHLRNTDPGFDPSNVLALQLSMQGERYPDDAVAAAWESQIDRIRAIPGVESATAVSAMPIGAGGFYLGRAFLSEGQPEPPVGRDVSGMWTASVPGYFATMRIPLIAGRDFTDRDGAGATPVMIVSREFVRQMFPDGQALGKRVRSWRDENVYREIVGVVDDLRYLDMGDELRPTVYVPHRQDTWRAMAMVVRAAGGDAATFAAPVRDAVRAGDAELPILNLRTLDEAVASSLAPQRFGAMLLAGFAIVALALTTIGVYGVLAYSVSQRTREVGIRMALGARPLDVMRMVVSEAGVVVAAGTALGVAAALALTRTMQTLLYEVSASDPGTFAAVTVLLFAVAVCASLVPARRATRVAPVEAIREA